MTRLPRLPRVMIAAPSTGQGKTIVATGLMAALRAAGLAVSGHKVGPDYIDPGYHSLATGRPGRNLDPHLVGDDLVVPLLLHGAATPVPADVAVIEGVMGLHDGRLGTDGFASSAHVARLTRTPVVVVLDVARQSRTAAAQVLGLAAMDPLVRLAGVILNRAKPGRNTDDIVRALSPSLPVLGVLPPDDGLSVPSRHLGLVPAAEREVSVELVDRLGEQVARYVDLDTIVAVAQAAPDVDAEAWDPTAVVAPPTVARPVVALAAGRAFTFRYPETEELLRAAGCEPVGFDPLADRALPPGTRAIYLGGGFPEVYAAELAANRPLLADLRAAVAAGVPTVAECAGLLYLADSLDGVAMAGAIGVAAEMSERLTLRYPEAVAAGDSLLTRAGERVTGHEFHRTVTIPGRPEPPAAAAWTIDGEDAGFAGPALHASYLHVHWAGHPQLAQRFADAAHAAEPHAAVASPPGGAAAAATPSAPEPVPDPLRHHGDAEAAPGLLDLAVNVFAGPRPAWLDRALVESLVAAGRYPDAGRARAALAERHRRSPGEVLPTAGGAEAFTLVARLRPWRHPVVVHPQFTEPHAALEQAGHRVHEVLLAPDGFTLDPAAVPEAADLVVLGNPTNPTGVLHPAATVRRLVRAHRLVVVDEAFMDAVPGEPESLVADAGDGLLVVRSLTKHWSLPGIRAGYLVGGAQVVAELAAVQTPWSVSAPAIAAIVACSSAEAISESDVRARSLAAWRDVLVAGVRERGLDLVASQAPFVLVRLGEGAHRDLRARGVAVRRADTFPGLDSTWVRIAVRPPAVTARLLSVLDSLHLDSPDRHEPDRHEPDRHEPDRHEPDRHEPDRHEPDRHEPDRHEPDRHAVPVTR